MGRLSEEQKKDWKIKITVGVILFTVIAPILACGPFLHKVVEHAKTNKTKPWAAGRLLFCADMYSTTGREEQAHKLREELYLMYAGNDWEADFDTYLEETGADESMAFYLPWVASRYDGYEGIDMDDPDITNRRPAPMSPVRHAIMGDILIAEANYYEGKREYDPARHIWKCLFHMWPKGSPEHNEAVAANIRDLGRSF